MTNVIISGLTTISTITIFDGWDSIKDIIEESKNFLCFLNESLPQNRLLKTISYTAGGVILIRLIPFILRHTEFFKFFDREIIFFHRSNHQEELIDIKKELLKELKEKNNLPKSYNNKLVILEINIGSGTNLSYYPTGSILIGTDIIQGEDNELMEKNICLADDGEHRRFESFRFIHTPPETLQYIPDETVSCVVSFHSMCTSRGSLSALREIKRVLKPKGKLYFIEHTREFKRFSSLWFLQINFMPSLFLVGCCIKNIESLINKVGFSNVKYCKAHIDLTECSKPMHALMPHIYGYAEKFWLFVGAGPSSTNIRVYSRERLYTKDMLLKVLLLICLPLEIKSLVDCSLGSASCETCMIAYPTCFWCASDSYGDGKCLEYRGEESMQRACSNGWPFYNNNCRNHMKKDVADSSDSTSKLSELLGLLTHLKKQKSEKLSENVLVSGNEDEKSTDTDSASSEELQELLHKLLLLKLLRKWKNEGSSALSESDRKIIAEYTNTNGNIEIKTTTTASPTKVVNMELNKLLSLLKEEKEKGSITDKVKSSIALDIKTTEASTTSEKINKPRPALSNHVEASSIDYEEAKEESLLDLTKNSKVVTEKNFSNSTTIKESTIQKIYPNTTTAAPSTTVLASDYCELYESTKYCNNDNNCTWCNTQDICIHRNDDDYKSCAKVQRLDDEFGLDKCLEFKHCKLCVEDEKCYWCDVSKSCHTYPFFGYVPQSCGGDWYVKQCDVQLAVIVIVLPLIIILLAMITFYFCLKYCYYRKKILRVPLFERPGVFDYRKDKKVYFVNPEDEDSQDEMQAETIRKKYRLPAEKAPLIDPNS